MKPNLNSMLPVEAVRWLTAHLPQGPGTVVELGSGHGSITLRAAIRPARLLSVEHDERFMEFADVHAPIADGWYDRDAIARALPSDILAVVVDGPPAKIGRAKLVDNLDLFPRDAIYLIDDVHRSAELEMLTVIVRQLGRDARIHMCDSRAFATIGGSP